MKLKTFPRAGVPVRVAHVVDADVAQGLADLLERIIPTLETTATHCEQTGQFAGRDLCNAQAQEARALLAAAKEG